MSDDDDSQDDAGVDEFTDPAAYRPNERRTIRWYQHPSLRISEIVALVGMASGAILFARAYDERIVLLEERLAVIREELHVMEYEPGNVLTQPSKYSIEKFREDEARMDRLQADINYHRTLVIEDEKRLDELWYSHRTGHN